MSYKKNNMDFLLTNHIFQDLLLCFLQLSKYKTIECYKFYAGSLQINYV